MELTVTLSDIGNIDKLAGLGVRNIIVTSEEFGDRANRFFRMEELEEVIGKAKELDMRTYLNLNVMVHEFELEALDDYLRNIAGLDLEGIYFNDVGILQTAIRYGLAEKMIFNPDTLMTNSRDIGFYLDQGLKGVVISKELTLDEILKITDCHPDRLDFIIHGRLCMSYSRRMFIANYMKHTGNDYDYKASARLDLIEATREGRMPIMENRHGTSLFTDYTMCSYDEILQLDRIARGIIDDVFLDFEEVGYGIGLYNKVIAENESKDALADMRDRYPESNYDSGYMYRKTNLVK